MPGEDSQDAPSRITDLLQRNETAAALQLAEAELEAQPDDGRLNMIFGVALAQAGRLDEATIALRKATMLSPSDPEAFANLAVHLYDQGDKSEAAVMAREALKIDPTHSGATATLALCEEPTLPVEFEVSHQPVMRGDIAVRPGPDTPIAHVFGLGQGWTIAGYSVWGFCILATVLIVSHLPFENSTALRKDPLSVFVMFAYVTSALLAVFWMTVDVIDRRQRFIWLLPIWVCGLSDLAFIPLGLYLFIGRKVS